MAKSKKIWFARKQDGELLTLNEKEALTMRRDNNISRRMNLEWIGVIDRAIYYDVIEEGKKMLRDAEQLREKAKVKQAEAALEDDKEEKKKLKDEAKEMNKKADNMEVVAKNKPEKAVEVCLEKAKENGMEEPNQNLDIITPGEGMQGKASPEQRRKVLNAMGR